MIENMYKKLTDPDNVYFIDFVLGIAFLIAMIYTIIASLITVIAMFSEDPQGLFLLFLAQSLVSGFITVVIWNVDKILLRIIKRREAVKEQELNRSLEEQIDQLYGQACSVLMNDEKTGIRKKLEEMERLDKILDEKNRTDCRIYLSRELERFKRLYQ